MGKHDPWTFLTLLLNGKIMLASVIILFVAVILILCFHSYARWLFRRQNRRIRRRISAHLRSLSAARDPTQSSSLSPLDPTVLEKIPIFVYSSSGSTRGVGY
ncbi:RING-H2 finger protein ATL5 [Raphanus sativus]|nr:RING-H2 finger protein ATL5 [Raphanus sativus]